MFPGTSPFREVALNPTLMRIIPEACTYLLIYLFYSWLCRVSIAAHRQQGLLVIVAQSSLCGGFSCCGARALERRLSSFGARA